MEPEKSLNKEAQALSAGQACSGHSGEPFLELHWEGRRFKNIQFPVSAAKELGVVESAIKALAREMWIKRYRKQRVPKGFSSKFNLFLDRLSQGCVNTVLVAGPTTGSQTELFVDDSYAVFDEAAEVFLKILAGEADESEVVDFKALDEALTFGKTLEPEDEVKLYRPGCRGLNSVVFTRSKRADVREKYGAKDEEQTLQISGWVASLDAKGELILSTYDGQSVKIFEDPASEGWNQYKKWLAPDRLSRPIRMEGNFLASPSGKISKSGSIDFVEESYPDDWYRRMAVVMNFADGWIDGQNGEAVSVQAKRIVDAILSYFYDEEILEGNRPGIYPLLRGGIQLEWDFDGVDWSIEVDNVGNVELSAFGDGIDLDGEVPAAQTYQETTAKVIKTLESMTAKAGSKSDE
ncbi:hypothetical protein CPHO_11290 [Corynebacterium phocae]|uniref:Uncharacterized protein n=1 Tax=Corynebacterium phocae TaxID=161895 RepID=A0A1L7D610_9CORY|nr:hypothetical protein [Corynebacterium phocae]APT93372.1 hypothetical protein CPHO_11290 [Corynebacterium phocae]KAA8721713.1 hypothetical protein F4V58_10770 [Corynebacterium phocae]